MIQPSRTPSRYLKPALEVIFIVVTAAVLFAAVLYAGLQIFGMRFYEVTTPSMTGTYDKGAVVAVHSVPAHEVKEGDVIAFRREGYTSPIIHRVTSVTHQIPDVQSVFRDKEGNDISTTWKYAPRVYTTKGDANPIADTAPVDQQDLIGEVQFGVPYPFNLLVSGLEKSTLLLLGVGSIVLFILWEIADGIKTALRKRRTADAGEQSQ